MIDEKELIEQIKSLRVTITGLRAEKSILNEYAQHFKDSVLKIIDEQQRVDEWVPVEKRLPRQWKPVLITYINVFNELLCDDCAYINEEGKWIWCFDESLVELQIIAWKPLPKPYKEVKNENR